MNFFLLSLFALLTWHKPLAQIKLYVLDMEATGRFRKKVEKDESYQRTIVRLGGLVEQIIRQNNAIDVYEKYFTEEPISQLKQDTPR